MLDTGAEALLARAWLADHATESIEVQYFIWSTDNIGILAAEALLRAADRGVRVRVIVDDLLIDAPDKSLLALARHPNIDIRIYNPKTSVGVPLPKRLLNVLTNFRGVNQRMHDKTLVVDGKVAITGGRNMAAEYFDYNHKYNFRDRDALLLGEAVKTMQASFESFWNSELSVKVEELYDGLGLMQRNVRVDDEEIKQIYRELHEYAKSPENFAPEVRAAIAATPAAFAGLAQRMAWGEAEFISDRLIKMGLQIFEYKPEPDVQRKLMRRSPAATGKAPVFALHAKTLVIDSKTAFIGTFNFDPRSENLNTEVGAIIHDEVLARAVEASIETDMAPGNSWDAAKDDPDQYVSFAKRSKARFFQLMPIKPLL